MKKSITEVLEERMHIPGANLTSAPGNTNKMLKSLQWVWIFARFRATILGNDVSGAGQVPTSSRPMNLSWIKLIIFSLCRNWHSLFDIFNFSLPFTTVLLALWFSLKYYPALPLMNSTHNFLVSGLFFSDIEFILLTLSTSPSVFYNPIFSWQWNGLPKTSFHFHSSFWPKFSHS